MPVRIRGFVDPFIGQLQTEFFSVQAPEEAGFVPVGLEPFQLHPLCTVPQFEPLHTRGAIGGHPVHFPSAAEQVVELSRYITHKIIRLYKFMNFSCCSLNEL